MSSIEKAGAPARAPVADGSGWLGELRDLLVLAWPLVVAQLAQIALFTTDVVMLGWLGPQYLAAGNLTTTLFNFFLLGSFGVVGAVAPMVAQAIGARDGKSVRRTVRQGLWLSFILSALLMPIFWNAAPILGALGQEPEITQLSGAFAPFAVWLVPAALMQVVLRSFLSAKGDTRIVLAITLCGVVVNAVADYALIFGNFGLPRMEIAGSGLSTSLVNWIMLSLTFAYVLRHRRYRRYHLLARFWRADWSRLRELARIGGPIGLMVTAEVGIFSVAAVMMGWLGTAQLAAHAVAMQFASIAFMVPLGLSQATTVRVGLAYGRRSPEGVRKAGWTSLVLALLFMSTTSLLFVTLRRPLVGLFLDPADPANGAAIGFAAAYLGVAGLFQLFDGTQVVMAAALRGLSDTAMPLVVAIIGYWGVGLPIAYIAGFVLHFGGTGLWVGLAAGLSFVAIVLTIRFSLRDRLGLIGDMTT